MASYTTNLNLKKPAGSENVAIGDINNNMDIIDNAYGNLNNKTSYETLSSTNGDFTFGSNVSNADQLYVCKASKMVFATCIGLTVSNNIPAWSAMMNFSSANRPLKDVFVPIASGATGYIQITTSGNVIPSVTIQSGTTIRTAPCFWKTN